MHYVENSNPKPANKKYREIIAQTVCGNVQKFILISKTINTPEGLHPTRILGSTITEHKLSTETGTIKSLTRQESGINIRGTVKVHVWYAYNNEKATAVVKKNIPFTEIIPVPDFKSDSINPTDIRMKITKGPECIKTTITEDNRINVNLNLEVSVEIIGETRILARVKKP